MTPSSLPSICPAGISPTGFCRTKRLDLIDEAVSALRLQLTACRTNWKSPQQRNYEAGDRKRGSQKEKERNTTEEDVQKERKKVKEIDYIRELKEKISEIQNEMEKRERKY